MANRRSEQLRAAVKEFMRVHQEWVDADDRPNPDESYADAIDAMFAVFEAGEIPADCRQLTARVLLLQRLWDAYLDQRESGIRRYPENEFWEAREALEKALTNVAVRPTFKPLETIQQLREQKVSDRQIASIYGFLGENGEPQPHMVQQEIDNPGTHIGPDWVDPRVRAWEAEQAAINSHADNLVAKHQAAARAAQNPQAPESLLDLWEQGVTAKQAAKILDKFVDEVEAEFRKLDEQKLAGESKCDGDATAASTAEKVYALADQNMTAEAIAKELKLKPREVSKIIKERPPVDSIA